MNELATYTFLPWLRQGIANQISGQEGFRASIPIDLILSGDQVGGGSTSLPPIHKDIQIYGPGDIVGLDKQAIIKVESLNWITNFEPNYLPYIEFYDEDLPWRYSPLPNPSSGSHRLTPWISLIVLREDEFEDSPLAPGAPLPAIRFLASDPASLLPPSDQLWAWAHVHINRELINTVRSENANNIQSELESALDSNPDLAYARLLCPRRLKEKTGYHAFLVPAFESGRLAGLGEDPSAAGFDQMAWSSGSAPTLLPYYYRWYFKTGSVGDFEYLVRLLEPKPADKRVGLREMDVQKPGGNIKGIRDEELEGFLRLGGALRVPRINYTDEEYDEVVRYDEWTQSDYPHPFQESLAAFINLASDYKSQSAQDAHQGSGVQEEEPAAPIDPAEADTTYTIGDNPDPLITAPLYAQWHALTDRLLSDETGNPVPNNNNWVHELNLDPRWRVAAGFGTKIIQQNQEDYMKSAWAQVGDILKANQKIKSAQLALSVSTIWYENQFKFLSQTNPDKWMSLSTPLTKRIMAQGTTVHYSMKNSLLPQAALSKPMRQALRPRGKLARRLPFEADNPPEKIVNRLNLGEVTAAPAKVSPDGAFTLRDLAESVSPDGLDKLAKEVERLGQDIPGYEGFFEQLTQEITTYRSQRSTCVEFFRMRRSLAGPFKRKGAVFRVFDHDKRELRKIRITNFGGRYFGLDTSFMMRVDFPCQVTEISVRYSNYSTPPTFTALDASGKVIRVVRTKAAEGVREVNYEGRAHAMLMECPQNETLVHQVCFVCEGFEKEREKELQENAFSILERAQFRVDPKTLPKSPNFNLSRPEEPIQLEWNGEDSEEAIQFKEALGQFNDMILQSAELGKVEPKQPLDFQRLSDTVLDALDPRVTLPKWTWGSVKIPDWIRDQLVETFVEAMAYPEFDFPMYQPLVKENEELFLPNIQYVEQNSITLLETNQRFIESYMVGLNHEMGRELLWREYPTDQRGSYFRQFWDVTSYLDAEGMSSEDLREKLKDIPELHKWPKASQLGDHDNRELNGDKQEEVVLVIRGELLKKYPNAVVYSHRAEWGRNEDGEIDLTQERNLVELTPAEEANPPRHLIKTPLYEARVEPDIHFFGFDLTACQAKGGAGEEEAEVDPACVDEAITWDDPGWFFVIKERPGEPRFGLDIGDGSAATSIQVWNDLSWDDITPAVGEEEFIQITPSTSTINLVAPVSEADQEKEEQHDLDQVLSWSPQLSSAELAYILYQVPVLVAVHASEMLPTN